LERNSFNILSVKVACELHVVVLFRAIISSTEVLMGMNISVASHLVIGAALLRGSGDSSENRKEQGTENWQSVA